MSVVAIVLMTYKPAGWLTSRIVDVGDSFGSHIMINILCTVFLMPILLTVVGTWIGTRHISMEPMHMFSPDGRAMLQFHFSWKRVSHSQLTVW